MNYELASELAFYINREKSTRSNFVLEDVISLFFTMKGVGIIATDKQVGEVPVWTQEMLDRTEREAEELHAAVFGKKADDQTPDWEHPALAAAGKQAGEMPGVSTLSSWWRTQAGPWEHVIKRCPEVISAAQTLYQCAYELEAALAARQPGAQERVAWASTGATGHKVVAMPGLHKLPYGDYDLYAAPPAQGIDLGQLRKLAEEIEWAAGNNNADYHKSWAKRLRAGLALIDSKNS